METFEINSLLRLLRSSIKSPPISTAHHHHHQHQHQSTTAHLPNPAASTNNFIISGQRFETLKSLRRQLRKHFTDVTKASGSISFHLIQSIFEVLKNILSDLVVTYFESHSNLPLPFGTKPNFRKASISVDTVFAAAVQRNEILEIIQICCEIVAKCSVENLSFTENALKRNQNFMALQEECYGKVFLPEVIALLGHESSDVQRFSIRFLLQYMSRTHNLHRFLEHFITHGLEAANPSTQFGSLQAVSHLFIRNELKPENLSLLVGALGRLLVDSQNQNRYLFYPTYVAMERLNALLGSKRFYRYLHEEMGEDSGGNASTTKKKKNLKAADGGNAKLGVVLLYENIQKRAPSPQVFLQNNGSFPPAPTTTTTACHKPDQRPPAPEPLLTARDQLALLAEYGDHDFIEDTFTGQQQQQRQQRQPYQQCPVLDLELEQELAELEELEERLATTTGSGQSVRTAEQQSCNQNLTPSASSVDSPQPTVRHIEAVQSNPGSAYSQIAAGTDSRTFGTMPISTTTSKPPIEAPPSHLRVVTFASPPTTSQIEPDGSRISPVRKVAAGTSSSSSDSKSTTQNVSQSTSKLRAPSFETTPKATVPIGTQKSPEPVYRGGYYNVDNLSEDSRIAEFEEEEAAFDAEMAATMVPGLSGYTALDADTLANLEYIPTLKDYYPYHHPYYYDTLYPLAPPPLPPHRLAPVVSPAVAPIATAAAYGNLHLLRFGIFPRALIYQALSTLAEEQFAAVQSIVRIVRDAPAEHLLLLVPYMDEFLTVFVAQLLLDGSSNFKVILWTLDIIELLGERLTHRMHPYLSQIVLLLSRRLGDNRIVIRDSVIKVYHQLAQRYAPQEMLDLLFKHVATFGVSGVGPGFSPTGTPLPFTSSAKLREELANRVTATVSTFPRGQLNLPKLCFDVAPLLVDRRALVRLASLECVASLAQALGPHKLGSLMTAVHSLDTGLHPIDMDRLVSAIQARLARRSLPRTGPDGNVQYVLRVPGSSEQPWYYRRIYDADLEWIALGPTNPVSGIGLLHTPTTIGPIVPFGTSDYPQYPPPPEDKVAAAVKLTASNEEERLHRQEIAPSIDSEDIPPPVRSTIVNRSPTDDYGASPTRRHHRSLSRASLGKAPIDPMTMAGDQVSFARNFADFNQQREVETRAHSLERSKTSQDQYPRYGSKQDLLMERMIRGESIDDNDLMDAQWMRKSSVESIEAWRQYFGRFKKQLAEMAVLNGGTSGRYGSRPSSGAVFYGSPLPPYGLSPAAYYYYYHNGLSHSYHDLSQLQQQNMEQIMKRSGFIPEGLREQYQQHQNAQNAQKAQQKSQSQEMIDVSESPVKSPPPRQHSMGPSWSAKYRAERDVEQSGSPEGGQEVNNTGSGLQVDDTYPLERSISMPAIPGSSGADEMMMMMDSRGPSEQQNVISDEVIQEVGMWEQVIQEEKKEGPSSKVQEEVMESSAEEYPIEDISEERDVSPAEPDSYQEDQMARTPSPVQEAPPVAPTAEDVHLQIARKQSIVPVVSVQQPTPNISAGSDSDRRSPVSDEDIQQKMARRESVPKVAKQESTQSQRGYSQEEAEGTGSGSGSGGEELPGETQKEATVERQVSQGAPIERQASQGAPVERQFSQEASAPAPDSENSNPPGDKPKSGPKSGKAADSGKSGPSVTKSGIPGPPARRLSRLPQQLYIKTTPAIPMNANIQHILANVARTEGPFDQPGEAVKAAVIALHDNAWTTKVEGMLAVVRLATFHPHFLIRDQHQIALHLVAEIRNLRSTVSRSAIFTIGELFSKLKSQIEPEQDILVQALMYKVGENSIFIREDIDRALQHMVDYMPQTRSALSLITYGSNHRNTYVRRTSAQFLSALVEKMGAMKCLLGPRDIGEHLLPAASRFIQDGSPHTRYFGRRIFAVLMQHPLFDKLLRRHISPGTYRNICGMLETIKRRGVGDRPADLFFTNSTTKRERSKTSGGSWRREPNNKATNQGFLGA